MISYTADGSGRFRTAQPASGSAQSLVELNVVNPEECDVDFVLHAFDSALPYLASIGSEAQWGTEPFSQKPKVRQAFADFAQESYGLNTDPEPTPQSEAPSWQHLTLYEVKTADGAWLRVAAQGVSTSFPDYVPEELAAKQVRDATDYLYLNYLIADRRTGDLAKGAGNRLVEFGEQQGRARGKTMFYGDCWRGNRDGLMR